MANSSIIGVGVAAVAAQMNNLRDDILNATTGHDHDGATSFYLCSVPVGVIIMWSGAVANIPTNWQLTNGTNGTPDLRNQFVIGAGTLYAVGATGGSATKVLTHTHDSSTATVANESAHTHGAGTLTTNSTGAHDHAIATVPGGPDNQLLFGDPGIVPDAASNGNHTHGLTGTSGTGAAHNHTLSGNVANGGSATQDIMPAYWTLCYIQRIT